MNTVTTYSDPKLLKTLKTGGLAVIPTDTVYGIVALASNQQSVEKIFTIKGRDNHKALIVLVASVHDIPGLNPQVTKKYTHLSSERPTSLIVPKTTQPDWLTRGGESVAYRVPNSTDLRRLLTITGPLVAPSANPQGLPTANTISQAMKYFTDDVDMYVDGGEVSTSVSPSRLVRIRNDNIDILRE